MLHISIRTALKHQGEFLLFVFLIFGSLASIDRRCEAAALLLLCCHIWLIKLPSLTWEMMFSLASFFFFKQMVTEKHKMNVPETMNEVLDMSDDEGMEVTRILPFICVIPSPALKQSVLQTEKVTAFSSVGVRISDRLLSCTDF